MSGLQLDKATVRPGQIDRESVRKFVGEYTSQLEAASYGGENVHQLALDQQDMVDKMTANWSDEDVILFSKLYSEELSAYTHAANDKAMAMNAQTSQALIQNAQNASNVATWISLIVFFIVVISFINIMK